MNDMNEATTTGILTIDLQALQQNYQNIRDYCLNFDSNIAVSAVVKANGYGLGMAEVSTALYKAGCRLFYVATPDEGMALRKTLADIDIFILDGLFIDAEKIYQTHNLIPCLSSQAQISNWYSYGQSIGTQLPCVLHLNTGINRLGLNLAGFKAMPTTITQSLNIHHVMSHFASADVPDDAQNLTQIAEIKQIVDFSPQLDYSFGNSPGIAYEPLQNMDFLNTHIMRPGVALCGVKTTDNYPIELKPVVSLFVRVLQTSSLEVGDMVGYGHQFTATKPMRTAIVAAGYADGMFRSLATSTENSGYFEFKGHKLPILGRV